MKGLWKYLLLGIAGRLLLMVSHNYKMATGIDYSWLVASPIILLAAWWGFRDIRRYLRERKIRRQMVSEGRQDVH